MLVRFVQNWNANNLKADPLCSRVASQGGTAKSFGPLGLRLSVPVVLASALLAAPPISAQDLDAREVVVEPRASLEQTPDQSDVPSPMAPVAPRVRFGPDMPQGRPAANSFALNWENAPPSATPKLVDALDRVSRTYPSIAGARAGIRAAASDVRGAKWQRFPSLSVETSFVDSGNTLAPSVGVSAPIWAAGRISSTIRRASSALDAQQARYRETVMGLAVEASQAYFEIQRLSRREALISESLEEHGALVASMERRVAQEVSPLVDLELARSRYAQIEQELMVTRAQRQSGLFGFLELVGDPNFEIGTPPAYSDTLGVGARDQVVADALGFDPTLARLSAELQAGQAEVAIAKASIYPQLNAQYSYNDIVGSRVGVVAKLETAGGLSRFSAVDAARARVDSLVAQLGAAQRQIRQKLNGDVTEFDAAMSRASISINAARTARNVSASYVRQFIAGRRSWLDVMNALRETLAARLGQADAEISALSSLTRLSLRTGRWSPFEGEGQ